MTPDTVPSVPQALPAATIEHLRPDSVESTIVAPGVVYRYVWTPAGPWAIHLVQADLARCELGFDALQAEARENGDDGHERVTSMVSRRAEGSVLVAVNADFFTPEGDALGPEVRDGKVRRAMGRPAIAWSTSADPWIGTARVEDDTLHLGWPVSRSDGDAGTDVVGGYPELLAQGDRVGDLLVADNPSFAASRHPRTAVGFDADRNWVWIVVVDGRQLPHSDGMTLPELTELFETLGVDEALNLDGGGSSVMVVDGEAVNRPSDITGERPVVNGLALIRDQAGCSVNLPR